MQTAATAADLKYYTYETAGKVSIFWNNKPQPTPPLKSLAEAVELIKQFNPTPRDRYTVRVATNKEKEPYKYFSI